MDGGGGLVQLNDEAVVGLWGLSLEGDPLGSVLSDGLLVGFVLLHSGLELLLAVGRSHVLDSHVHELLDDSAVDELVHSDAEGSLGDVEHDAGSALVALVGHTLVDGGVHDDVDVVTDLEGLQVDAEGKSTSLSELLREKVSGSSSVTE